MTAQYYIDTLRTLMAKGMTPREACEHFDEQDLSEAMFHDDTPHEDTRALLEICAEAMQEKQNERDSTQAIELWLAGWTSEAPHPGQQGRVMSWYWRAPPKGKRPLGRRYLSTNQAFMALKRQQQS